MKKVYMCQIFVFLLLVAVIMPAHDKLEANNTDKIRAAFASLLYPEDGRREFCKKYQDLKRIELVVDNSPIWRSSPIDAVIRLGKSNDLPDIIEIPLYNHRCIETYWEFILEKKIIPLNKYIERSHVLKDIDYSNFHTHNGEIYGFPLNKGIGHVTYIRKDWLDNLGLNVPSTWDELYEVMKAFTFNDPDKNGKNDTIGYVIPGIDDVLYLTDFYQDSTCDFEEVNGKWRDGFIQPKFRKAIKRLQQVYQEKLIMFTEKIWEAREKFYNGEAGIISFMPGSWLVSFEENLRKREPNAKVIAIPAIENSNYLNRYTSFLVISTQSKYPDVVFKNILEYMNDGGEGQMLFTHGVRGVHYKVVNNKYVALPRLSDPRFIFTYSFINPELVLRSWDDPFPMDERIRTSLEIHRKSAKQFKFKPYSKMYLKNGPIIDKIKNEIIMKIVKNENSLEKGMKIYYEKSKELGVEQILKEFNSYNKEI